MGFVHLTFIHIRESYDSHNRIYGSFEAVLAKKSDFRNIIDRQTVTELVLSRTYGSMYAPHEYSKLPRKLAWMQIISIYLDCTRLSSLHQ